MISAKFLTVWEKLDKLDTDTSEINDELLVICDEAVNLQKELDELKASISKIKADAVRGAMLDNGIFLSHSAWEHLEYYANQLEGKE